jgi:hypothetical protein
MAVVDAHRGRAVEARVHLEVAQDSAPAEFKTQERLALIEQGLLWFESRRELDQLRAEAERLLASRPP